MTIKNTASLILIIAAFLLMLYARYIGKDLTEFNLWAEYWHYFLSATIFCFIASLIYFKPKGL
jgi:hypothetical protein